MGFRVKICSKCKVEKEEELFYRELRGKDNLRAECKSCTSEDSKIRHAKRTKEQKEAFNLSVRSSYLKRVFGITLQQYDKLLLLQEGRCYICQNKPRTKKLAVDHDHKTKEVRGLLCMKCNRDVLGSAHDKVEILQRAVEYLLNPPAQKYKEEWLN